MAFDALLREVSQSELTETNALLKDTHMLIDGEVEWVGKCIICNKKVFFRSGYNINGIWTHKKCFKAISDPLMRNARIIEVSKDQISVVEVEKKRYVK